MNRKSPPALLLLCLLFSGCTGTTVYEAAIGYNTTQLAPWSGGSQGGFDGPGDTFRATVRREYRHTFVSYSHISHISAGKPFNSQDEDWLEMVEFGVRFSTGESR